MTRQSTIWLSAIATLMLAFGFAAQARAHSELLLASPAPGEQLAEPPTEIRLTFNEPAGAETAVLLFTNTFQPVGELTTEIEPRNPRQVFVRLPPLEPGVYTVQWTAVSVDGHPISGSYAFELLHQQFPDVLLLLIGLAVLILLVVAWRWQQHQKQQGLRRLDQFT